MHRIFCSPIPSAHGAKRRLWHGWKGEDIFLSMGHISPVFYSVLARFWPLCRRVKYLRHINSRLQGHQLPTKDSWVRVASVLCGQRRFRSPRCRPFQKLNKDSPGIRTLRWRGITGRSKWEAFMFGAAHKVDNLILTVDYNGQQIEWLYGCCITDG